MENESKTENTLSASTFKNFNKKLKDLSVPVIMNDIHRLDELYEIKDSVEDVFKETEIEDYLALLNEYHHELQHRITNNLKAKGLNDQEDIEHVLGNIVRKSVIIGDASVYYNCHGWSTGLVKWVGLDNCNPDNFAIRVQLEITSSRLSKDREFITVNSVNAFHKTEVRPVNEGSIVAYYDDNNNLAHTARYLTELGWYEYKEELHEGWYERNNGLVRFDANNKFMVENYTSKLGLGYLIVHEVEDIAPLYGNILEYYEI